MISDCTFNEADHPRYPHGQFAPKRNDPPASTLAEHPAEPSEIVAAYIGDDGIGYQIQESAAGYRWIFEAPEAEPEYSDIWFPTMREAVIAAADDWKTTGTSGAPAWAHDLQKAADAERAEHDRAELAERRALAAQLRRAGRDTPTRSRGIIAQEVSALARDARLVGEGAIDDLKGYAGAVFD